MTSRALDMPARSAPAVLDVVRHAAAGDRVSAYRDCPRCPETPVLHVLKLGTSERAHVPQARVATELTRRSVRDRPDDPGRDQAIEDQLHRDRGDQEAEDL